MYFLRRSLVALALASCGLYAAPQTDVSEAAPNEAVLRLARQIQRVIGTLPNYGVFDDIRFDLDGGKVVLSGDASRPTLKKSVERALGEIEGVSEIENKINVLPNSTSDDRVRAGVYARIYGHPSLSRYDPNRGSPRWITPGRLVAGITNDPPTGHHPIHIIVKNGNVRLEGIVNTVGDKTIAGIQANHTPGAFKVDNDLDVLGDQDR